MRRPRLFRHCSIVGAALSFTLSAGLSLRAAELDIPFTLMKPAGNGPFPAIVMLHDCSGLGPKSSGSPWRWSTRLMPKGYVIIWPDSFSSRGHPDGVCTDPSPPVVRYVQRADDAYATLAYLRTLPYVDPKRIAVMGGSHGGSSTLFTVVANRFNAERGTTGFAAAIAIYPGCGRQIGKWRPVREPGPGTPITGYEGVFKTTAPLLILSGELDDWTPAEPCKQMAERAKAAGEPVDIVVYPGAHHGFDSRGPKRFIAERVNSSVPGGHGATTEGNPEAWAKAILEVESFLAKHLASP
ncbi:MAG: dienelactone hydrolase family protein [Proteobacteria bacterium]|nr:dienelactone hydrolase family protein [Pseudomonadota bacterium]